MYAHSTFRTGIVSLQQESIFKSVHITCNRVLSLCHNNQCSCQSNVFSNCYCDSVIDTKIAEEDSWGGCFGTGPGRLQSRQAGILVDVGGTFQFMSKLMESNNSYEFTVTGRKGSRSGTASHTIQVAVDDPPPVEIE